eukprot:TRINITY_DN2874_c0_g2_i1.p1 TRINITY_DN2874_c0_g2~~TRINITY_DN2874_c0_g2_i1.p1  ORF type:complete len:283 (+),score=50.43 TRINITY_DN2874_c0_g2_i1:66-851(+)
MAIDFAAMLLDELDGYSSTEAEDVNPNRALQPECDLKALSMPTLLPIDVKINLPIDWVIRNKIARSKLDSIWLIQNAMSEEGERNLSTAIQSEGLKDKWISLHGRKLQEWGGTTDEKSGDIKVSNLPEWLVPVADTFNRQSLWGGEPCNHILINRYTEDTGIMAHTDGPKYHPLSVIVSLLQPAVMIFKARRGFAGVSAPVEVFMPPRSVLIFADSAYETHTHEIPEGNNIPITKMCCNDSPGTCTRTGPRLSLTIRRVLT